MQYELKSVKAIGNPFTKSLPNGGSKYGINIIVKTGIVGNTYSGFCNNDGMFFELDKNDTIQQSEVKMNAFAIQYVLDTYPNT